MKAFLSYLFGDDISAIIDLLKNNQVEVFDSMSDLEINTSLQQSIKQAIEECDLVVLIFSKPNTNLAFETGLAVGMGKPLFVVIAPDMEIQDYLFDSTYVMAMPGEVEKIVFGLHLFLQNVKPLNLPKVSRQIKYYGGSSPQPSNFFHTQYKELKLKNGRDYEGFIQQILEAYQLKVVHDISTSWDLYADFSIWSDQLSSILGNPILIEVKETLNAETLQKLEKHVKDVFQKTPSSSFLIFYGDLKGLDRRSLPQNSKCLYIDIKDLVINLQEFTFNEAVMRIRNKIAHNTY